MTIENLSTLTLHKFKSTEQYEKHFDKGNIQEGDFCLVPDEDLSAVNAVKYTQQNLTAEQQIQARNNIGINYIIEPVSQLPQNPDNNTIYLIIKGD